MSLTVPLDIAAITATSAASFAAGSLAPEAIGALFGTGLAASAESASTTTLPTTLGGVQLQVTDAAGMTRDAPLFFVSPTQLNFQVPQGTSAGAATLTIVRDGVTVGQGMTMIETVTPGLFAASANGQGVAAAVVLRVKSDGTQSFEPVVQFDQASNSFEAVPIDLGATTDQVFLIAYGTGLRNRSALAAVTATIGGANADVSFAGAQGSFTGLDQINIALPRTLIGRGIVDVVVRAAGKPSNTVTINVR